jgi:AbrB family looped-hinge helix DNA binding protein
MAKICFNKFKEINDFISMRYKIMELAKVTSQGQITIPAEIRKYLNVKGGDKVVLIKENGRVLMANSTMLALKELQEAFEGVAERMEIETEQDIVSLVKAHRRNTKANS